ncbi:MAG: hypothetical protein FWG66_12735 [Spirochaetes bacterium]|nr:hypothetical protein [Spirochaetota bacterium]
MYKIYLTFHLEANSSKSIDNTFNRIKKTLEKNLELEIIGIDKHSFVVEKEFNNWENCVYGIIKLSQEIGREWIIYGTIDFGISLWTNNPTIMGVKNIEISCDNKENNL